MKGPKSSEIKVRILLFRFLFSLPGSTSPSPLDWTPLQLCGLLQSDGYQHGWRYCENCADWPGIPVWNHWESSWRTCFGFFSAQDRQMIRSCDCASGAAWSRGDKETRKIDFISLCYKEMAMTLTCQWIPSVQIQTSGCLYVTEYPLSDGPLESKCENIAKPKGMMRFQWLTWYHTFLCDAYVFLLILMRNQVSLEEFSKGSTPIKKLLIGANFWNPSIFDDHNAVHLGQVTDAMRHQDSGLVLQKTLRAKHLLEDVLPHMWIHSRQRVIQQIDIGSRIYSSCQGHTLFLASAQIDTLKISIPPMYTWIMPIWSAPVRGSPSPQFLWSPQLEGSPDQVARHMHPESSHKSPAGWNPRTGCSHGDWHSGSMPAGPHMPQIPANRRSSLIGSFTWKRVLSWILTFTLTEPEIFSISPNMAESREDFPQPTVPTIAMNWPRFTLRFTLKTVQEQHELEWSEQKGGEERSLTLGE